jgi:hypothetical protein
MSPKPRLHILTKHQMLCKFIGEHWEEKLALCDCTISPIDHNKTIKRWFAGNVTMGCIRAYKNNPDPLVCFLRDGDDLYSYDEAYFTIY